ncbi:MAG: hypothetical protein HC842_04795 [Cytophagales bacterium]|nr:hypothetical protein [Cytophagales bacterium]
MAELEATFPAHQAHFDLEDCDRILRVEAPLVDVASVLQLMSKQGLWAEVLPDEVLSDGMSYSKVFRRF